MIEFTDEITVRGRIRAVNVQAEWVDPMEGHCGFWDVSAFTRRTGEDLYRFATRADQRRLDRRADELARASYDDAWDWRNEA